MKNRLVLLLFFTFFAQDSFAQGIDCASAIEMTSYDDCRRRPGNTTRFSSNTLSSACGGRNEDGGWFKFKAITGRSQISVSTDQLMDMAISVYKNCDVEIICVNNRGTGGQEILAFDTDIGVEYFIQVYEVGEGGGEFLICLSELTATTQSDCIGAAIICQDGPITFNSRGSGLDDFENSGNEKGCLLDKEHFSVWYYFELQKNAPPNQLLTFTISPESSLDYDFAIYGPDVLCDELGYPIRCSWANEQCDFCPKTGLDMAATDVSEGAAGDGFVAPLLVQPGAGYFLLLDNKSQNATGFVLEWGGSAVSYLNCSAEPPCGIFANAGANFYVCEESTLTLDGSIKGRTENLRMEWTGSGATFLDDINNATPTLTLPTNFTTTLSLAFNVQDADCLHSDSLFIINNCVPEPCPNKVELHVDIHPPNCSDSSSGSLQIGLIEGQETSYKFQLDNGNFQSSPYFPNLSAGQYLLRLRDERGCQLDTILEVPTTPLLPELDLGLDVVADQGKVVDLQLNTNLLDKQIADITWTGIRPIDCPFPCLNPSFTATNSVYIEATIQTLDNCTISDGVQLKVEPKIDIYIPSAFSPNGDGINDVFMIYTGSGISKIKDLKIADRWGNVVFQATDFAPNQINAGWDGRTNNQLLNPAIFVYFVEVVLPDGQVQLLSGEVALVL